MWFQICSWLSLLSWVRTLEHGFGYGTSFLISFGFIFFSPGGNSLLLFSYILSLPGKTRIYVLPNFLTSSTTKGFRQLLLKRKHSVNQKPPYLHARPWISKKISSLNFLGSFTVLSFLYQLFSTGYSVPKLHVYTFYS